MAYKSDTIAAVIKRLNNQYFIPAIQRRFIWDQDQVISLFDSIMRGYPIGSFLFWELDPENRNKWESYRFVEDAIQGGTSNTLANIAGVQDLTLILDGQQRLTSLLIGLKGTYTIKKKYRRYDAPDAWKKQRLYLDLLKDPKIVSDDGESGIHYGFWFLEEQPDNDDVNYWIRVDRILDFDSEDRFYEFRIAEREKLPEIVTKGQITLFERNLERLYRAIWKDDFVSYYVERDQDYDRVLDIFVRANEGGEPLSKSDLLLSMITSKWGGINAREEIYNFVERLNSELARRNSFNKDFIMKSCLVLSDLPVAYKVSNFNNQSLDLIKKNWTTIKAAIEKAVSLINIFGIDAETLTSANALIPISYYFFQHERLILTTGSVFDIKNASIVRKWVVMSLLNNVFGGSSDSILTNIRAVLQNNKDDENFPLTEINKEIARSGRISSFNEDSIERFLQITYSQRLSFLALSLLYDENNWGIMSYQRDHIFPQSLFTRKSLEESGIPQTEWYNFYMRDYISNLELLSPQENQEKSGIPFDEWIKTRDSSFKKKHLIPDDPELYKLENFNKFVEERDKLITDRLFQLFGPPETKEA